MRRGLRWFAVFLWVWTFIAVAEAGAVSLDDTWVGDFRGHTAVFVLRERAGGRLIGYLPADPGTWIAGGQRTKHSVTIEFAGADPGLSWSGTFSGAFVGPALEGPVVFSDRGPAPLRLRRSSSPRSVEHWILIGDGVNGQARVPRVEDHAGGFLSGGFVNSASCDFLACGGQILAWGIAGPAHTITTASGGACPTSSSLAGSWDSIMLLLNGSWLTAGTPCSAGAGGAFSGGKEGLAQIRDVGRVLELLQEFADRIEEESPAAAQAFSSGYLHDGKTRADWEAQLAAVYAGYNKLQARIESIRQIVTDNDGEVNPIALMPPRIEWRLVVTGRPAGGGAPVTVLEITSRLGGNEELFWIGREHGHFVFVGDGATEPFRIAMPILPGDEARAAFGIWPFGVHGGGHPEGHPGWDVEYQAGGRVRAAAGGVIVQIEPNGSIAGQSRIRIRHRPGYETVYDHVGALESGIVAGATVAMGQALAEAGDVGPSGSPFYITHFAVSVVADAMCPAPFLSTDGLAVFNTVWTTAAYAEELAEPFPCNPVVVTFPLGRTWSRTVGSLAPQIVFTRTDPNTTDYRYALLDAAGGTTELGSVVNLQPLALPTAGYLDLQPDEGGAPHLGIYNILDGQMSIDWGASRPADLSSASVYGSSPPGP